MESNDERERLVADAQAATRRFGFEPGDLQSEWRGAAALTRPYDAAEMEAAIVECIVILGGGRAWPGDGASCAEQIVRCQYEGRVKAESERDDARRAMTDLMAGRDRLRAALDQARGVPPAMVDQQAVGDCYTACIASLTGIPLHLFPGQPVERSRATEVDYVNTIVEFLKTRGWMLICVGSRVPAGYAIATGPSPRDAALSHCVVVHDGVAIHDPHPSRAGIASATEYEVLIAYADSSL